MKTPILAFLSILAVSLTLVGPVIGSEENKGNSEAMVGASATAVFAGGCFWCTEADFEKVPGVSEVISGYTGGTEVNPTYEQVSSHATGHVEAVKVIYDPGRVSYGQLVEWFWRHVNPTDDGGQFVDRGAQYRSLIFTADERQQRIAEASKRRLALSGYFDAPIVTEIRPLGPFYPAEAYHQDYHRNNPTRYSWYRSGSGRNQFLNNAWSKQQRTFVSIEQDYPELKPMMPESAAKTHEEPAMTGGGKAGMPEQPPPTARQMKSAGMATKRSYPIPPDEELRQRLTPLQYNVTRENGTERPFANSYWNNHAEGIYVDIISGEPLFSSTDKYESGTGWPSFTKPLTPDAVVEQDDIALFSVRTEVRSMHADSHLGHVFEDGPAPTGLRYCINSAALRFIPKDELEQQGYTEYLELFK